MSLSFSPALRTVGSLLVEISVSFASVLRGESKATVEVDCGFSPLKAPLSILAIESINPDSRCLSFIPIVFYTPPPLSSRVFRVHHTALSFELLVSAST